MNDNKSGQSKPEGPAAPEAGEPGASGLASHFVRRTDADFAGKPDKSLIGRDIPIEEYEPDELDEDGEPL